MLGVRWKQRHWPEKSHSTWKHECSAMGAPRRILPVPPSSTRSGADWSMRSQRIRKIPTGWWSKRTFPRRPAGSPFASSASTPIPACFSPSAIILKLTSRCSMKALPSIWSCVWSARSATPPLIRPLDEWFCHRGSRDQVCARWSRSSNRYQSGAILSPRWNYHIRYSSFNKRWYRSTFPHRWWHDYHWCD